MSRKLRVLALWAFPIPLLANTGIPMVAATIPMMVVLLVPIVLIEAEVVRRTLGEAWWKTIRVMFTGNLITTFLGLPISNLIAYVLSLCATPFLSPNFLQTHWTGAKAIFFNYWFDDIHLTLSKDGSLVRPFPHEPGWYFPLAISFAFFINLFVSSYLEYLYMRKRFAATRGKQMRTSLYANFASYCFLVVAAIVLSKIRH